MRPRPLRWYRVNGPRRAQAPPPARCLREEKHPPPVEVLGDCVERDLLRARAIPGGVASEDLAPKAYEPSHDRPPRYEPRGICLEPLVGWPPCHLSKS
jgi:hypothetical protein